MYNRYTPQSDGSHRRNTMPEPHSSPIQPPQEPSTPSQNMPPDPDQHRPCEIPAKNFFQQLLPSDLDTGDLIVILILLLMAADRKDQHNTALLTLALYLFL